MACVHVNGGKKSSVKKRDRVGCIKLQARAVPIGCRSTQTQGWSWEGRMEGGEGIQGRGERKESTSRGEREGQWGRQQDWRMGEEKQRGERGSYVHG